MFRIFNQSSATAPAPRLLTAIPGALCLTLTKQDTILGLVQTLINTRETRAAQTGRVVSFYLVPV